MSARVISRRRRCGCRRGRGRRRSLLRAPRRPSRAGGACATPAASSASRTPSAPSDPRSPSKLPPFGTESMCDPKRIGGSVGLACPSRRAKMLPAGSMRGCRPAAFISRHDEAAARRRRRRSTPTRLTPSANVPPAGRPNTLSFSMRSRSLRGVDPDTRLSARGDRHPQRRRARPPTAPAGRRGACVAWPIPCLLLLVVRRAAARFRDVFLLDAIDVELRGAGDDLVERFVEVERRRLREPRVVHARDDERLQVRARQPLRLQLLDRRADRVVQLQDLLAAAIALLDRLGDRFVEKGVDAAEDRLIGAAAQARPILVADAERQERRLLELEGERAFGVVARASPARAPCGSSRATSRGGCAPSRC